MSKNVEYDIGTYDLENKYAKRNGHLIKTQAKLILKVQGSEPAQNVTISVDSPDCIECPQSPILIESIKGSLDGSATPYIQNISFYSKSKVAPSSLNVTVYVSYLVRKQPKVTQASLTLPFAMVARVI